MPFIDEPIEPGARVPGALLPDPAKAPQPTLGGVLAAAARDENAVVSAFNWATERAGFVDDPDHNPLDVIGDTPYERNHLMRFVGSRSDAETRAIMGRIDREEADDRLLDAAGFGGTVVRVGMGLLDPTLFLPGGAIYKGARAGSAITKSALSVGAAAAGQAAISEGILYGTQETRSPGEVGAAISGAAILGGLLGAAIGTMSAREVAQATTALTDVRRGIDEAMRTGKPAPAGAAVSATTPLTLESALGAEKALGWVSPVTRLQQSPFDSAKAAIRDIGDAGLSYRENWDGVVTSEGGTVETRVKLWQAPLYEAVARMDDAYARYFFGREDVSTFERRSAGLRAGWARSRGETGKMTFAEFREEVGKAMVREDQHPIPQVAEAAKAFRERVFNPLWDEAVAVGVPGAEKTDDLVGAPSYLTRIYNREKMTRERETFINDILLQHLRDDQTAKAAAKQRLEFFSAQLRSWESQIKKLEAKFDRVEARVENIGERAKERGLEADRTAKRAETLEERKARIEAEANELAEATDLMEELVRGNPQLAAPLSRTLAMLERRGVSSRVEGARASETTRGARFNERRLGILTQRLDSAADRRDLLEDYLLAARSFRDEVRTKIEKEIAAWEGKSSQSAKSAIKAREQYDAEKRAAGARDDESARLASADSAIDRAVRQIINSDRDLIDAELRQEAENIVANLLGESAQRIATGKSGSGMADPTKGRVLRIPDEKLEPWLERDVEKVARAYTRTLASDIELTRKFGDPQMTEALAKLQDEYNVKASQATTDKERVRLRKDYEAAARDIGALRDRIRGTYGMPDNPDGWLHRAGRLALNANYLARLGGMTVSSIPDFARPIMRYGLDAFRDGWVPLVRSFSDVKLAAREVRLAGTALDMIRDQRLTEIADILDDYGRGSKFERGVQYVADRFGLVTLMSPWNAAMKSMAGVITMAQVMKAVKAVSEGKATAKQVKMLAQDGSDEAMARRIWAEAEKSGNEVNGLFLPNTEDWTDEVARRAFRAILTREVDALIVTPGLEKSLWMSKPLGRIIGQFKSFSFASTQRTMMAGLQQRDASALTGVMVTLALGALTAKIKSELRGEDTREWDKGRWAAEALDNSGLLGIIGEAGNIADKWTGGKVGLARLGGKEVSRYQSRNAVGALLGPTFDFAGDMAQVSRAASTGEIARSDIRSLRQVLPLQNLFYVRQLFDRVEQSLGDRMGLPDRRPRRD